MKKLEEHTIIELKAMVYDRIATSERVKVEIEQLNNLISQKSQQELKNSEKKGEIICH